MFIYKIENTINGKVYIGKTERYFLVRWNAHKYELKRNKHYNKYLQSAWNKYGESSFVFEVIETFNPETNFDINNLEKHWIKFYESKNRDKGYNLTDGGEGTCGVIRSAETRKKMSIASKGRRPIFSAETRKKLSEASKGRNRSFEARKKQSEAKKGKKITTPYKSRKPILCLNNNKIYNCAEFAAKELNLSNGNISSVCKGKRNHTGGYKFQYYIPEKAA